MDTLPPVSADMELLERCLAGDQIAWETFFHRFRQPMAATIARRLWATARVSTHVEEILADFWFALVDRNGRRLRLYDPTRSSLLHYLGRLACEQVSLFYRRQARWERLHVQLYVPEPAVDDTPRYEHGLWREELWASLSALEQRFLCAWLAAPAGPEPEQPRHSARDRKVKQRVRDKLCRLLGKQRVVTA
jgi:hypothetical protein